MKIRFALTLLVTALIIGYVIFIALRLSRPSAYVEPVARGKAIDAVSGTLRIEETYRMQVRTVHGGKVKATHMAIGRRIVKDELLLQLDTENIEFEIESIEIDKEAHQKHLALGSSLKFAIMAQEVVVNDLEELDKRGSVSQRKLQAARRRLDELREQKERQEINDETRLKKLESSLATKRRQLEAMSVNSPIDGTIVSVPFHEGDLIGPGSVIAEVLAAERRIVASISEEDFSKVRVDQDVTARLLGYGDEILEGRVSQLLPTSDPTTQRYSVFLELDFERERLTPGLTGEVSVIIGEHEDALLIPHRALLNNVVYVVNNGIVELRSVKTGYEGLNLVEIVDGLEEGESVIVEELDRFREGIRVKL